MTDSNETVIYNVKEIDDVDELSNSVTLPATQQDLMYIRHPLANINANYVAPIVSEIELDKELGLKGQVELDQNKLLKHDIDELTKSNNYYQITLKLAPVYLEVLLRNCRQTHYLF